MASDLGRILGELKRRNVYKVAAAYVIIGWLIIQVTTQVFPFFEIPNWAVRLVILLVVIGFPIALVMAWAFELTPQGIKRTEDVDVARKHSQRGAWIYIVLLGIAASVGLFFLGRYTVSRSATSSPNEKSIAVLPFENLSEEKANAYFADGIQDELLTRLSKIHNLKVISRTSTQKYKTVSGNLREIAQQLGVSNILEGSVQRAADQVRVSVQLINALNDSHIWAETYDRKLVDLFQVESDIAQKIAGGLEAKLTGREKAAMSSRGTQNPQAYEAYLHGIALRNSETDADQVRRRDYFREAVKLDPNFATAWAELAGEEANRYFFPEESPEQKERARVAAETALRLAPDSAAGKGAMALYYYYVEKNYDEALRWLEQASDIAPNDSRMILDTAVVKRRQGKLDEAIALQKRAAELDPLNVDIWVNLARSYRGRRDLVQARVMLDRALAISPGDSSIITDKAETYVAAGDLDTAWSMVRDLKAPASDHQIFGFLINVLIYRKQYDEAVRRMTAVLEADREPLFVAIGHAALGALRSQMGQTALAQPLLEQAERELRDLRDKQKGGIIVLELLTRVEAKLGRRDQVEKIGRQMLEMRSKDKWTYPLSEEQLAMAYAALDDADRAVPLLERALHATCAVALTPAYLRFDPIYDRIRSDPRFEKLAHGQL